MEGQDSSLEKFSISHDDLPFVTKGFINTSQLNDGTPGFLGSSSKIGARVNGVNNTAYLKQNQEDYQSCLNSKADSNSATFEINPKTANVAPLAKSNRVEFNSFNPDVEFNVEFIKPALKSDDVAGSFEHTQSNLSSLNLNPDRNLASDDQNRNINNHTNINCNDHGVPRANTNDDIYPNWTSSQPNAGVSNTMAHDANTESHSGTEFYSNKPMETESMTNSHPPNDKIFNFLNSPMEIDTPSGVPHNFNQPMDEANTPKKIADIKASIAALNQRVHQPVLNGNKQWALPALPRP
ncbi:hypothetical protein DSO57_1037436 [Entomophthora muscae]|uniref:Uncharacterized protein n=1 Tax=Entomophthora muscae TaxID=34485 RepID=A0ACC2S1D1_9FUNG|nr:hypothetical protein DSO57_1037436 [Entomophthora muscae]